MTIENSTEIDTLTDLAHEGAFAECDHALYDVDVQDEGFSYAGTHATGGQAGHVTILVGTCTNCGAEVPVPEREEEF